MENKDYCSPEEERTYERPIYETAEEYNQARREQEQSQNASGSYSYNQFENNNSTNANTYGNESYYGNSGYGTNNYGTNNYGTNNDTSNGYTNMGGQILDSNGKPLKNRFGMKLTFSILEMLCCCTNCFTFVLGIVSCIFTCQANTSYKEGRFDEFKSKAKISTITLIVGAALAAFTLISNGIDLALNWDEYETIFEEAFEEAWREETGEDIDMDNFWEEMDDYVNEDYISDDEDYYSDYNENADHENFDDFNQIMVGGVTISLPCTYADLEAAGFFMNQTDLNTMIDSYSDEYFELHCQEKTWIADVQIVNDSDEACKAQDGMIIFLDFYYESEEEKEIFEDIEFVNGLDAFQTVDGVMELLGEPNRIYKEDSEYDKMELYAWEYQQTEGYYSYVATVFYDGVLTEIQVNNGPEEY